MDQKSIFRKKIVMDRDAPYVPQEIITNILTRLPVKSLIRFQCVSKDWKNLFKTPSFIAEQIHHSTYHPCLVFKRINPQRFCLMTPDMQEHEYKTSPFTCSSIRGLPPFNSNNGLVCLQLRESKSWYLWNPAVREVLDVFKPLSLHRGEISYLGFSFSPIVNDYKMVRLVSTMDVGMSCKVEVFSLCTRLWKKFEVGKLGHIMHGIHSHGFTFNGAIFWISYEHVMGKNKYSVVSFDVATEEFTLIPFPKSLCTSYYYKLTCYENKLAVFSYDGNEFLESYTFDLWVMDKCIDASKETCIWTKIYTSNPYPYVLHPMTIWRNEIVCKAVLENEDEARLVFCNLSTDEFKEVGKCSFTSPIWSYAESIISDLAELDFGQNGIGGPIQKYHPVAPRRSLRLKKRALKFLELDDDREGC